MPVLLSDTVVTLPRPIPATAAATLDRYLKRAGEKGGRVLVYRGVDLVAVGDPSRRPKPWRLVDGRAYRTAAGVVVAMVLEGLKREGN